MTDNKKQNKPIKKTTNTKQNAKNKKLEQKIDVVEDYAQSLGQITSQQVYTKEVLTDFADYTVKSNKSIIVVYICAVLIFMCAIAMFTFGDIASGIMYVVLGLFFAFYGNFVKILMLKNNKNNIGNKDVYSFEEDSMKVETFDSQNKQISSTTILYENLHSVKKHKSYGFIYVNKAVAYIVNMQNFKDVVDFNFALVRIESAINSKKIQQIKI